MPKLYWDKIGEREYETGVDHGVLYPVANNAYGKGVAWNGLSKVTESPSGGEETAIYADNIKYLSLMSNEDFGGTIEAYMSPTEFDACDGTATVATGVTVEQQGRKSFGFAYRTLLGNDTDGNDYGEKIHLVYGAKAQPSSKDRSTVNDSPEATALSWEFKTTPVVINSINPATGKPYKPTSHLIIKSTEVDNEKYIAFQEILYGKDATYAVTEDESFTTGKSYYEIVNGEYVVTEDVTMDSDKTYYEQTAAGSDARLPLPDEVIKFFKAQG